MQLSAEMSEFNAKITVTHDTKRFVVLVKLL